MELSARKEKILAAVCGAYVLTGDPVGSKLIAAELGVSSATVRNDMAELSDMGFLAHLRRTGAIRQRVPVLY